MTEFVQLHQPGGLLFLPREFADTVAPVGSEFRDIELLSLTPERIAGLEDDADVVDGLGAVRRRRSQLDALEARFAARLQQLRGDSPYVGDEVALELRISRHAGDARVGTATALLERMPTVLALMDEGEVDGYTASRLVDTCRALSDENAREVDARLADKHARGRLNLTDPVALRRATRRLADRVEPTAVAERAKRARCDRLVQLIPGEDSMSRLIAELPAELAASAYANVDKQARRLRNSGDDRTLDQLRADVLGDLLCGTDTGTDTGGQGVGATVFLHMPITAALTMTDDGCELAGYGPIPGPIARDIMTRPDSVLRKVLVDPSTGRIEGLGRTRRTPNQALRDLIAVRDRECPFCHRPASQCDIDHLAEWVKDHGPTDPDNLGAKCERDHYLKDAPGWQLDPDADTGTATITTPAGRSYPRHRESIIEPAEPEPPPPPPPLPDKPPF